MVPSQITIQKQPSRGVLKKKFLENMQKIYRRTHLSTCGLNKAAMLKFIANVEHILHTVLCNDASIVEYEQANASWSRIYYFLN